MDQLHHNVTNGKYKPVPNHYSDELKNVIMKCLNRVASARPSMADIMLMPITKKWGKKIFKEKIYAAEADKYTGERLIPIIKMPGNLLELNNKLPRVTYDSENQWCIGYFDKEAAEKLEAAKLAKLEKEKKRKEELQRRKVESDNAKMEQIPDGY